MFKYTLTYTKGENVSTLGHLDILRAFTRALRRAELPISYSQGFNPHNKLTFELPTGVGITSLCEQVEMQFDIPLPMPEIKQRLNDTLPSGMKIIDITAQTKREPVTAVRYAIEITSDTPVSQADLDAFFASENVPVEKSSKTKTEQINIMHHIGGYKPVQCGNSIAFEITLAAGGSCNIKPSLLVTAMQSQIPSLRPRSVTACKLELLRAYT